MSKAAVDQLTRCSALELAGRGVRVNAVNPGVIVTELHRRAGMDADKYRQVGCCRSTGGTRHACDLCLVIFW